VTVEHVHIPPGEFLMGSGNQFFSESPAHPVSIRSGFLLGKSPVTQAQWLAVNGDNQSAFCDLPDHPVDSVTWDKAVAFCRRLSDLSGRPVRLPSEAEWEYACRAGTPGEFFFGPWGPCRDGSEVLWEARHALCEYAWFDLNSGDSTQPVGTKRPNPWGLHDMLGNVWEWCADTWHGNYVGAPSDGMAWVEGEERQPRRCLRGGAWDMDAFRCRSSYRRYDHRELATNRFGFRVTVDAEPGATPEPGGIPAV
jgi:formylglycine-generating enzyme required for sulfatase activity